MTIAAVAASGEEHNLRAVCGEFSYRPSEREALSVANGWHVEMKLDKLLFFTAKFVFV